MFHEILQSRGGVCRTSELLAAGLSRHHLERQVSTGALTRFKKGWIALPTAPPELVFAAAHGLTLSCVTQAARLGLWVHDATEQHYAVARPGAEIRPACAVLHYMRPLISRPPFPVVDAIENVLACVASCQPHERAVATWDSALNKRLVSRGALERLPLSSAAKRVLADTNPFADSGLESYVRLRLRWLPVSLTSQVWLHGHRVDFLIGARLVLQIDGGTHVGAQRTRDNAHDALLALHGYTVIRVGYTQVMHAWHEVQDLILRAIAQELHLAAA